MNHSRRVVVSYEGKYVLVQGCPGKSVVRSTDRPVMTIALDWDVKQQTNKQRRGPRESLISYSP